MLKDEYSEVTAPAQLAEFESLPLESGLVLRRPSVAYHTWGALNAEGTNGVFVAHALTGNSDLGSWWASLLGPGCAFDTRKYFVFCSNVLGSTANFHMRLRDCNEWRISPGSAKKHPSAEMLLMD